MSILCKIFGHKATGYGSMPPYLTDARGKTPDFSNPWRDGTGRGHVSLYAKCDRCNRYFHYAYVHVHTKEAK